MEEVFSVKVWLFKLNYQPLTPSSPHQSRVQRPQNISLVFQHCSPLKHPRAFLSPSLLSLASPRPLPSLWCLPWLHTETPLHLCRGTAHPRGCPGLGADTGTPATGTRLYPKSGYFFCKGGRNGAAWAQPSLCVWWCSPAQTRSEERVEHCGGGWTSFAQPKGPPVIPWLCSSAP